MGFTFVFFLAVAAIAGVTIYATTLRNRLNELAVEHHQTQQLASTTNQRHDEIVGKYNGLVKRYNDELARWKQLVTAQKEEIGRLARWKDVADADLKAAQLMRTAQETLIKANAQAASLATSAQQNAADMLADANARAASQLAAAESEASAKLTEANTRAAAQLSEATTTAEAVVTEAKQQAKALREETQAAFDRATSRASQIIEAAEQKAIETAGGAYEALKNASLYEKTVRAMKHIIEGYGDEYIVPPQSMLDDLADGLQYAQAGQELKNARENTKAMIRNKTAAACDYADASRRETAINFVLDAFNGKVDSVLSRVKQDNAGKLKEEINDAFTLVNYGGKAFRNARLREEYLLTRLDELKWAAVAQQLLAEQRDEQRQVKEQAREEARAAKERERALCEAAKEEEMLRKAMTQAREQFEHATDEQKAKYEQRLQEMADRLKEAEERRDRAVSMAQQTKKGHVYIISNVGSFGEDVFKIGLTRRWDPLDRVRELGDASVPFGFDVHAMILADDAPKLEKDLHRHFVLTQVNKVNRRREFFRVSLKDVREAIENLGITGVKWTMLAEAREYRETIATENVIKDDPKAREDWINRQFSLDQTNGEADNLVAAGLDEE